MNYPPLPFPGQKKGNIYELGKWHQELGKYGQWETEKLRDFAKNHIIVEVEPCDTATGGILLLVRGYSKEESSAT